MLKSWLRRRKPQLKKWLHRRKQKLKIKKLQVQTRNPQQSQKNRKLPQPHKDLLLKQNQKHLNRVLMTLKRA